MDVSIVIVSYNTCQILDKCIVSIRRETRCLHEIIVVDNASSDDSCTMLRSMHPDVTLIENKNNLGFAKANNQGFALAHGKYFFMLNSDTVILDGAIDKLFAFMEQHQDVGICGPKNVDRDGKLQYNCDHFPSFWNTMWLYTNFINRYPTVKMFRRSRMMYWDYSHIKDVDKIMGCSLMIRSDIFNQVGQLDINYFMYFEETDLCFRVKKLGQRIVYIPTTSIIHYGGESAAKQSNQCVIDRTIYSHFLKSQYYFYRKYYGLLPMLAIRALDLCYGSVLLLRNICRGEKAIKVQRYNKGKALCSGALQL
jgi:GT2 family glycosyltransferase